MDIKYIREAIKQILITHGTSFTYETKTFVDDLCVENAVELIMDVIDHNLEPKKIQNGIGWMVDWLNLFPEGVKSGGKLVRSDGISVYKKLAKFLKDYSYSANTIMEATKGYLAEREVEGWAYTKCAVYLIHKQGEGSQLASLCEQYEKDKKDGKKEVIDFTTGLI